MRRGGETGDAPWGLQCIDSSSCYSRDTAAAAAPQERQQQLRFESDSSSRSSRGTAAAAEPQERQQHQLRLKGDRSSCRTLRDTAAAAAAGPQETQQQQQQLVVRRDSISCICHLCRIREKVFLESEVQTHAVKCGLRQPHRETLKRLPALQQRLARGLGVEREDLLQTVLHPDTMLDAYTHKFQTLNNENLEASLVELGLLMQCEDRRRRGSTEAHAGHPQTPTPKP